MVNKRAQIEAYKKGDETKFKVSFSFDGRRVRKQGFRSRKAAGAWADASLTALIQGSFQTKAEQLDERRTAMEQAISLEAVYDRMLEVQYYHRHTESTLWTKSQRWANWLKPHLGSKNASSIDKKDVRRVVAKMMTAGLKNQSINTFIWDLNALLRDAEEEFGITTNQPFKQLKVRQSKRNYLEANEIKSLLDSAHSDYWVNAFGVMVGLGLRVSEAVVLNWSQVDFENGIVTIDRAGFYSPRLKRTVVGLPKYGSQAALPMTDLVRSYLENQLKISGSNPSGFVFPATKYPMRPSAAISWTYALKRALKVAGITKKIGLHDLRRSAITLLALSNVPLTVISKWARHNHMTTTVRSYIAFDEKRAFEEIKNLGTWDSLKLTLDRQSSADNRSIDDE